jgi:hypothetical protein
MLTLPQAWAIALSISTPVKAWVVWVSRFLDEPVFD